MIIEGKKGRYKINIGLEIHTQLKIQEKLFSRGQTENNSPNQGIALFDVAAPGIMPILNIEALKKAISLGAAINAKVQNKISFDRKNYIYPDLPNGYQITQFFNPILQGGYLDIDIDEQQIKRINISHAHLEQDAGKLIHDKNSKQSRVDFNRAGCALIEIVTNPDFTGPNDVIAFLKKLRLVLRNFDISDAEMDKGNFRCDVNISVSKHDSNVLGTRCEIKNLNSFKFIQEAIEYEANLHVTQIENNQEIQQATKLYNPDAKETSTMRTKENANDYRYIPDADIPEITLSNDFIQNIINQNNINIDDKIKHYKQLGISKNEIDMLMDAPIFQKYFDEISSKFDAKYAITWFLSEFIARFNVLQDQNIFTKIPCEKLLQLIEMVKTNKINNLNAKKVLDVMFETFEEPNKIVQNLGLENVSNVDLVKQYCQDVIKENPQQFHDYKNGKEKLFGFFVGQVMKKLAGKGNPAEINTILKDIIDIAQ